MLKFLDKYRRTILTAIGVGVLGTTAVTKGSITEVNGEATITPSWAALEEHVESHVPASPSTSTQQEVVARPRTPIDRTLPREDVVEVTITEHTDGTASITMQSHTLDISDPNYVVVDLETPTLSPASIMIETVGADGSAQTWNDICPEIPDNDTTPGSNICELETPPLSDGQHRVDVRFGYPAAKSVTATYLDLDF